MEWVETTGKTLEEAKDAALDELGVDAADAEFDIVDEPKAGLFGRVRGEARVRARVKPTAPRAKDAGRRRPRREGSSEREASASVGVATDPSDAAPPTSTGRARREDPELAAAIAGAAGAEPASARNGRGARSGTRRPPRKDHETPRGAPVTVASLQEQGEIAVIFLNGLLDAFGLEASVGVRSVNDAAVEIAVEGQDLGLLVGPRGATLQAIQELTRTAVLRQTGAREGWVVVDVAEYRLKRRAALEKFAVQVADQVVTTSTAVRLDPMPPADRKVVHDVLTEVVGVSTSSEGEEPRRRVVVRPVAD